MPILLVPSEYDANAGDDKVLETMIDTLLPLGFGPAYLDLSRPGASGGEGK